MALEVVGSNPITHPIVLGRSQGGKARDFDSRIRRFESCRPSHNHNILYRDPLAQSVEHLTFNQGVRRSNRRWVTNSAGVAELADALDLGSSAARRGSSILFARTKLLNLYKMRGSGSVVERRLAKANVAGSNPVFRSILLPNRVPNRRP